MPRDRTFAPEKGSWLPSANTRSSASRNTATCSPSTSAATPVSGTMSSSGHTRTGIASRSLKRAFLLFRLRGPDLPALGDEHHAGVRRVAVHEVAEAPQDRRRLDRRLPLAGVGVDVLLQVGLELGADAER